MKMASMNMPSGYSGIGTGTPTTKMIVTKSNTMTVLVTIPSLSVHDSLVDVLTDEELERVETPVSPLTEVDEVDDPTVTVEVVVTEVVKLSKQVNCVGTVSAVTGEANAKTQTISTTYLTQANPSTRPELQPCLVHISLFQLLAVRQPTNFDSKKEPTKTCQDPVDAKEPRPGVW